MALYSLELAEQEGLIGVVGLAGIVDVVVGLADVVGGAVYTIGDGIGGLVVGSGGLLVGYVLAGSVAEVVSISVLIVIGAVV